MQYKFALVVLALIVPSVVSQPISSERVILERDAPHAVYPSSSLNSENPKSNLLSLTKRYIGLRTGRSYNDIIEGLEARELFSPEPPRLVVREAMHVVAYETRDLDDELDKREFDDEVELEGRGFDGAKYWSDFVITHTLGQGI